MREYGKGEKMTDWELTELISNDFANSHASDKVRLTHKGDDALCEMWAGEWGCNIPSDIVFAGTIPLMDVEIEIDERDVILPDNMGNGYVVKYRVVILEHYKTIIEEMGGRTATIGAIVADDPWSEYECVIAICTETGWESFGAFGLYRRHKATGAIMTIPEEEQTNMRKIAYNYLRTWYSIQIAMLNPEIKKVFAQLKTIKERVKKGGERKTQRITRYVKQYVVNETALSNILYGEDVKERKRHTLCWYVCGHWRHYQSGRMTFIKGYWKGRMRDAKRNLDDGRIRQILADA